MTVSFMTHTLRGKGIEGKILMNYWPLINVVLYSIDMAKSIVPHICHNYTDIYVTAQYIRT